MVQTNLAETRQKAQAMIMQGSVYDPSGKILKAGTLLDPEYELIVKEQLPYVSRGGVKIAHALEYFDIDLKGLTILDVGASTGGFTDCALQHNASHVYALDVGHSQIHYSLAKNSQVTVIEKTNARYPFELPCKVDFICIDVSFISTKLIIPEVISHLNQRGKLLSLIKPQFEAGRDAVGKGGVIKDPKVHEQVLNDFISWCESESFDLIGTCESPILGRNGNKEFFGLLAN
mgnify:FL=1|tara:strand:- start:1395 stop:2090 length:696 start_codon:yes stop_codon:yes gene_type:complete